MDRILRDSAGQIDLLTYNAAGVLTDVDATNAPTVVVTDSAAVVVPGFTGVRDVAGTYHAALPSNLETLDTYTAAWNFPNGQTRRTAFEVVGGFLFTIADVVALGPPFASMTAANILKVRGEVEDVFEDPKTTGRAFRPRGRRVVLSGGGSDRLVMPDFDITRVVSVSIAGVAVSLSTVAILTHGALVLTTGTWTTGNQNVTVLYEYGFPSPPAKVRREALVLAKSYLIDSPIDDQRATTIFNDLGGFRLSTAGQDGWTGIPSVDACLSQYSRASRVLVG